jgi:adenylosuccinate synthase
LSSDGTIFTKKKKNFSSAGNSSIGNTATGIGAVFNDKKTRNFGDFYF